jgi:hypothetical protein
VTWDIRPAALAINIHGRLSLRSNSKLAAPISLSITLDISKSFNASRRQWSFRISARPFAASLTLHGIGGKSFGVVMLGNRTPTCANASPFLHEQDAAEQLRL